MVHLVRDPLLVVNSLQRTLFSRENKWRDFVRERGIDTVEAFYYEWMCMLDGYPFVRLEDIVARFTARGVECSPVNHNRRRINESFDWDFLNQMRDRYGYSHGS